MLIDRSIDEDYISFFKSLTEASSKPFDADTLETLSTHSLTATHTPELS